jgi:hypothetical protein
LLYQKELNKIKRMKKWFGRNCLRKPLIIAKALDMTIKALCGYIGINYRTAEAWTSGRSSPTDYIVLMIGYIVTNEVMKDGLQI